MNRGSCHCSRHCLVARFLRTTAIILACGKRCTTYLPIYLPTYLPVVHHQPSSAYIAKTTTVIILIVVFSRGGHTSGPRIHAIFASAMNRMTIRCHRAINKSFISTMTLRDSC